jgi:hypothetical protein
MEHKDNLIETTIGTFDKIYKKHPEGSYKDQKENMKHFLCMTARTTHFNDAFEQAHSNCTRAGYPFKEKISVKEDVGTMLRGIEQVAQNMKTEAQCTDIAKQLSCVSGMIYHSDMSQENATEFCKQF